MALVLVDLEAFTEPLVCLHQASSHIFLLDVHLDLEQRLKQFFNVEGAIYYSFGYCTVSSVIPCFAKKDDLLLVYVTIDIILIFAATMA